MNNVLLASGMALCASLAFAQATPPQTDPVNPPKRTTENTSDRTKGSHKMTATVVSTDQSGQQITVRDLMMKGSGSGSGMSGSTSGSTGTTPSGDTVTLRVEGKAVARLASVKAGDAIEVECRPSGSMSGPTGMGSTGSTSSGTTGSTMSGSGLTMADAHCASVTDIGKSKSSR
jgi:hypothetical protein